jgi:hypothetical protein
MHATLILDDDDMALSDLFRDAGGDHITGVNARFDEVAQQASPDELGAGVAGALHSEQTPPIGEMVSQLFGHSSSTQQADVLNHILGTLGPVVAGALASGALGRILRRGQTQVTPEDAAKVSPAEVTEIVNHAEKQSPGLADDLGRCYGEHFGLIKTLGSVALLAVLSQMRHNAR